MNVKKTSSKSTILLFCSLFLFIINISSAQNPDPKVISEFRKSAGGISKFSYKSTDPKKPCEASVSFEIKPEGLIGMLSVNGAQTPIMIKSMAGANTFEVTINSVPGTINFELDAEDNNICYLAMSSSQNAYKDCGYNDSKELSLNPVKGNMMGEPASTNSSPNVTPVSHRAVMAKSELIFDKATNTYSYTNTYTNKVEPFTGTIKENPATGGCNEYRFTKGKLVIENISKDCGKNGSSTSYYPNGNKMEQTIYSDVNKIESKTYTEWYENGKKKIAGAYLYGKMNGQWVSWYENGQKKNESTYANGTQTKVQVWDERGVLQK